ncbi:MAG: DUF1684 domain-containing protein [Gemmatimonadota bacterium]
MPPIGTISLFLLATVGTNVAAQLPSDLASERAEYAAWLESAPLSPYAILALQPVGTGISIGYEPSDIPLPIATRGIAREDRGAISLTQGSTTLSLPRGRPVRLEQFTLVASGGSGRAVIAAYGQVRNPKPPSYYPFTASLAFSVALQPPERRGTFRTLGLDGTESEASEVGFVLVPIGGATARLRVYRVGAADDDEAELVVYFRDATNGKGSYPAGRFLTLEPESAGHYRIDFNRARNPFCAYSSVYPCPAPWPGNTVSAPIEAGEQYHGAGKEKR